MTMKVTESHITLRNMHFYAYHGVMPQEQVVGGEYAVSLRVDVPLSKAVASDCIDDTLNYAALYDVVKQEMATPSKLIEHVAGRIGQAVLTAFPDVAKLGVTVTKLNPPMGADCEGSSVELEIART